jgi:hypothetical protein
MTSIEQALSQYKSAHLIGDFATVSPEKLNAWLADRRQVLETNPFDPRNEITADARAVRRTLWRILVLLPMVLGILFGILTGK